MSRLLLSAVLLWGVGCAGTSGAGRAHAEELRLGPEDYEPLTVSGQHITGPTTALTLEESALRGRFGGAVTSLEWTPEALSGVVGQQPTRLQYTPGEDGATRINGSFGGLQVDLHLRGPWLTGRFGDCVYDTEQVSSGFAGQRTCKGRLNDQIHIAYPDALARRSTLEQRALLTLALASDVSRSFRRAITPRFWNHPIEPPPTQRSESQLFSGSPYPRAK
ncbi:hypothetical protein P2318_05160 [Myxococcaceae bacterium GXIMD 01537]